MFACIVAVSLLVASPAPEAASSPVLLFYDPDFNPEDILVIVNEFTKQFEAVGLQLSFQPVRSLDAWKQEVANKNTKFTIAPASLTQLNQRRNLVPLLVSATSEGVHYRKILVDRGAGDSGDLRNKTIAAAVVGDDASNLLTTFPSPIRTDGAMVVSVGKDVDALLAVAFSQADAALTTPETLALIKKTNPVAAKRFRVVYEAPEVLRAPLCEVGSRASSVERKKLMDVFLNFEKAETGRHLLSLLGVERWVPFEDSMTKAAGR